MKQNSNKALIAILTVFAVLIIGGVFVAIQLILPPPEVAQEAPPTQETTKPAPTPPLPPAENPQYTDCDAGLGLNTSTEALEGRGTLQGEELWFVIAMSTTSRAEEGVEVMDQNGIKTYAKIATKLCDSIIYLNGYYS